MVITIGALLWAVPWTQAAWWFVPLLLVVIRPLAVRLGLGRSRVSAGQRWLIGWFGIRGVGSLYYLAFAAGQADELGQDWLWSTVAFTIVASDQIIHLVFGPQFADAAPALPILMGAFVLISFGYLAGNMIIILRLQRVFIRYALLALAVNAASHC